MPDKQIHLYGLNFWLFVIGMIGVWVVSHNFWALFWAFVASLHVKITRKKERNNDGSHLREETGYRGNVSSERGRITYL